jgi:hypothetical protein
MCCGIVVCLCTTRGNDIRATTYGSIKSILQNGLDRALPS